MVLVGFKWLCVVPGWCGAPTVRTHLQNLKHLVMGSSSTWHKRKVCKVSSKMVVFRGVKLRASCYCNLDVMPHNANALHPKSCTVISMDAIF